MYQYLDQPVSQLCKGSHFLLWASRAWTHSLEKGYCPPRALLPAFSQVGLITMLPHFHKAMSIFNVSGLDKLSFAPLEHGRITEHEAILLALWRDVAANAQGSVVGTLQLLVDEDAVVDALAAMSAAGEKLRAAGSSLMNSLDDKVK